MSDTLEGNEQASGTVVKFTSRPPKSTKYSDHPSRSLQIRSSAIESNLYQWEAIDSEYKRIDVQELHTLHVHNFLETSPIN